MEVTAPFSRGLYLHIPFCHSKCYYCDFVSAANPSNETRQRFFHALHKEVLHVVETCGRLRFNTLYLGGGTPSTLSTSEMGEVLQLLRGYFTFEDGAEVTCEVNPGDHDASKLGAYRKMGINRISLGAQAFQDGLLQAIGRRHKVEDVYKTVEGLRKAHFHNLSLDLMLKLPGQTVENFRYSLECASALEAGQITLYDLDVHPQTRFGLMQGRGELALPDEETHFQMFDLAEKFLTGIGYRHYELTSFARPGFESRHNLIYWHNQEYLGLGPGAFSYLGGVRYQFAADVSSYLKKCELGDWTRASEDILTDREKEWETLLTGLRLLEGVRVDSFREIRPLLEERVPELIREGVMAREGERFFLTRRGRFIADNIFAWLVKP